MQLKSLRKEIEGRMKRTVETGKTISTEVFCYSNTRIV